MKTMTMWSFPFIFSLFILCKVLEASTLTKGKEEPEWGEGARGDSGNITVSE